MTAPITSPTPEFAPRSGRAAAYVILFTILIVFLSWILPAGWNFAAVVVLLILTTVALGSAMVGRSFGVLINEQNLMSLSRFQMVAWTILVLAAYFAYVMERLKAGAVSSALAVEIDWHLWALMGISTTSLVGSSLILTTKQGKDPAPAATTKTAAALGEDVAVIENNRQGLLYANTAKTQARFIDMFQGEEIGNTSHVDLANVQMFYFTIISLVAFTVIVVRALVVGRDLNALPQLPDGVVALLGISHAGYLAGKTVTKTPVQQP